MKGLNLSGWSKTGEDKKTTQLTHENGHKLILAHSKLPHIQREALKRLKFAEGTPDAPVGDIPTMPQPAQSSIPVPVEPSNIPVAPAVLRPDSSVSPEGSAQSAQRSLELNADIEAKNAKAKVPQIQQSLNQQANLNQYDANTINTLAKHANELDNFQKKSGAIRPNAYLEDMSAGRKISTAIGLILGGMSVPYGGKNVAYDFLQSQIQKNVDAQKENFGQRNTIYSAYKDLYGNEQVASNMARVHQLDFLKSQGEQTAAMQGTATAKKNLMDMSSKIGVERQKLIIDSAGLVRSLPNSNTKGGGQRSGSVSEGPNNSQTNNSKHKELVDQGFISGNPSSQASEQKPGGEEEKPLIEPDDYADSPILRPGAQNHLDELRYTPKAKDEIDQIKSQYTQAQQADKILSQLHSVHQNLYKNAQAGGSGGYFKRHDPTAHIPFVGSAISSSLVQPLLDSNTNKEYEVDRTRIVSDIANALKGTNVSGEEINRIVDTNSPERKDSPELVAKKERAIRLFIKNSLNKSLLYDWNLSKQK